jgi:hypothetical protein
MLLGMTALQTVSIPLSPAAIRSNRVAGRDLRRRRVKRRGTAEPIEKSA